MKNKYGALYINASWENLETYRFKHLSSHRLQHPIKQAHLVNDYSTM